MACKPARHRDLALGWPRYLRGKERALAVPASRLAIRFVPGDGSGAATAAAEAGGHRLRVTAKYLRRPQDYTRRAHKPGGRYNAGTY